MCGFHNLKPLICIDLVGAECRTDLVVEDLGCGTRQGTETFVAQHTEKGVERQVERLGSLKHFERCECVNVKFRQRRLNSAKNFEIGLARIIWMNTALQAYFGGAPVPRFFRSADDLVYREVVGSTAEFFVRFALRERAELSAEIAHVGVIDIPR